MTLSVLQLARSLMATLIAALPPLCAAQATKPTETRYYPLAQGNVWIYHVHRVSPKSADSAVEWSVTHFDKTYQVWPKPMQSDDEGMELAVTQEGIKEIFSDTFIIRFPIRTGEAWAAGQPRGGHGHRTLRVLSVNEPCSAGNLKIQDCMTIEDEDPSPTGLKIVTTYARDLGPVRYMYYRKTSGEVRLIQSVTLTSHKFSGQ